MIKKNLLKNVIYYGKDSFVMIDNDSFPARDICLKILNEEFADPAIITQLENELDICLSCKSDHIRKAYKKETVDDHHAVVLQYINGIDLEEFFIKHKSFAIVDRLMLAKEIVNAVSDMHHENIIHGQLNPANILIENNTNKAIIIDFGNATQNNKINIEQSFVKQPDIYELGYISPEKTGRINRNIDTRSDLYSLGAILYKLFTGKILFETSDPIELVYCHIAKTPTAPWIINNEVPKVVSDLILKLLAKNAEDRYQSAFGLQYDIDLCIRYLREGRNTDSIILATNDYSGKYFAQQKLYGRDNEIKTLCDVFENCIDGNKQLLLVSGYSGCGKTALISELQKNIAAKNGIFIKGKFDHMQIDAPYFAFRQVFAELVKYILISDQSFQFKWKQAVMNAVGNAARVLMSVMPGIEMIIGTQPEVAELKGAEAQNRFKYVFLNFLHAILYKESPIVIFIDDLQWADVSSLELIKTIMNDRSLKNLMVIGTYRNNEVSEEHLLTKMINEFKENDIKYSEIELKDLLYDNVLVMLKDLLRTDQPNTHVLAELIFSKTNGNPFYVHEFVKTIYEEQLLRFDYSTMEWLWNKEVILEMNVSGNVVDFITSRIQKMPADTIDVLKIASCLGNRFEKEVLAKMIRNGRKQVEKLLQQPLIDGMIISSGEQYKFTHDRIQQSIYTLIPEEDKKAIHLEIGYVILGSITDAEKQNRIFDIVNHLNQGSGLITERQAKIVVAGLNLNAARKAVFSAAYNVALQYFENTLLLLDNQWDTEYDLMLTATCESAESAYFSGEYNKLDQWTNDVIQHSKTQIDATKGYEVVIKKLIAENKLIEAITLGLSVLDKMNIHFDIKPGKIKTIVNLLQTKKALKNKTLDFYNGLPEMEDAGNNAVMRILSDISSASYFAAPDLVPLLIFKMIRLTVEKGLSPKSPYTFAAYGFILSGYMGEVDNGIVFGQIALNMAKKIKADEVLGKIRATQNVFLDHWRTPYHETVDDLEQAFKWAMESGDNEWSAYAAHNTVYQLFIMGHQLASLAKKAEVLDQQIERFRQDLTIKRLRIFRQSIANLIRETDQPDVLVGEVFDEQLMGDSDISMDNKTYFHNLYFQKLFIALVFNLTENALKYASLTGDFLESIRGSALYPVYYFYQSLAITGSIGKQNKTANKRGLRTIKRNILLLKKYEKLCPENYKYKRLLIEAEYHRINGNNVQAKTCYDDALKAAVANNILHDLAICWERAALFFISTNEDVLARFYMQNAYKAYQRWGAEAKLKQMLRQYKILETSSVFDLEDDKIIVKEAQHESFIDVATIIRASSVLSGEIVLSKLLKKMMQLLLENVGAESGFFIMEKNNIPCIEAEISVNSGEEKILQSVPIVHCGVLAESVVNYVYNTKEIVLLDDASQNLLFRNDDFIRSKQSKSILCVPLIYRDKLQSIIYFSNDLTYSAFTEQRLALLKMISGQIAISIENALFYSELENKVQQRTNELMLEKSKSDDLLLNILPEEIANELKQTGRTKPRSYDNVTVMFTDFKDFTVVSENLTPEQLVTLVDNCFRKFDEITSFYNIEKIKTIGDAYLCVSGLPNPHDHNPKNVVKAAMEIIEFIKKMRVENDAKNVSSFDIRIGIHTGPIVAGVVGNKKFAYDIWGDTVNTAARMEQTSETNRINISESTYNLVKDNFVCSSRGKVHAKNKGLIDMYFIDEEIMEVAI